MLSQSVLPELEKKIQDELNTRLEQRIKELMTVPPSPPNEYADTTSIVTSLETDWRTLLLKKKHVLHAITVEDVVPTPAVPVVVVEVPAVEVPVVEAPEAEESDEVRLNIVGTHGPSSVATGSVSTSSVDTRSVGDSSVKSEVVNTVNFN
jgi:hypothetical protein